MTAPAFLDVAHRQDADTQIPDIDRAHTLAFADVLSCDIAYLRLTTRTTNCLWRADINTVRALVRCTADDLTDLRNFGPLCLADVNQALTRTGLHLKSVTR